MPKMTVRPTAAIFVLAILLYISTGYLYAQSHREIGKPYITNFTPEEYLGHSMVFASVQDKRGVMYFGTIDNICEYDGVSWRSIAPKHSSLIRTLVLDSSGTVYVGARNDFGYLSPDSIGAMRYISLFDSLDDRYRDCGNVWNIGFVDDAIYFVTTKYLLRYEDHKFHAIANSAGLRGFHQMYGRVFFGHNKGIFELTDSSLIPVPIPASVKFRRTLSMLEFGDQEKDAILLADSELGLQIYSNSILRSLNKELNNLLTQVQIFKVMRQRNGNLLICTQQAGLIVVTPTGEVVARYDKSVGLPDDIVYTVLEDAQGGIWVGMGDGISRLETHLPVRMFDDDNNIDGICQKLIEHRGFLYAATLKGLYTLPLPETTDLLTLRESTKFKKLPKITRPCWDLIAYGNSVLVASSEGVLQIHNDTVRKIDGSGTTFDLVVSPVDSNRVFFGLHRGLASAYQDKSGNWNSSGKIAGFHKEVRWAAAGPDSSIWLASTSEGVFRFFDDSSFNLDTLHYDSFDTLNGLPNMAMNRIFSTSDGVLLTTLEGIYFFNDQLNEFQETSYSRHVFDEPNNKSPHRLTADAAGNIWVSYFEVSTPKIGYFENGSLEWNSLDYLNLQARTPINLYTASNGLTWLAEAELYTVNPKVEIKLHEKYPTLIRRVSILSDSIVFGGTAVHTFNHASTLNELTLPYAHNSLRFEFAAPTYDQEKLNKFQFYLEGYEDAWSDWNTEVRKDYTNLPEGNYTFNVRARNMYNAIGEPASIQFSILPPWYRTGWAYIFYMSCIVFCIYLIVQWRSQKLIKEKETLEQIVVERTAEVEAQAEELKELDKLKSRFFANISHEFRTPLTLILGPVESMLLQHNDPDSQKQLGIMQRNGQRLLKLINQLLDLSKLESGSITLEPIQQPLNPIIRGVVYSFESRAALKNIKLDYYEPAASIDAAIDRDKLENILINLISNAFKFTPEGGEISVAVSSGRTKAEGGFGQDGLMPAQRSGGTDVAQVRRKEEENAQNPSDFGLPTSDLVTDLSDFVEITVSDSGIGIPTNRLPYIFDRFYQVDGSHTRAQEGTGIGLALTKELVELHNGTISVESMEGEGTTFTVTIPIMTGSNQDSVSAISSGSNAKAEVRRQKAEEKTKAEIGRRKATLRQAEGSVAELRRPERSRRVEASDLSSPTSDSAENQPINQSTNQPIALIVEDNADVREYIKSHLLDTYQVIEAANGKAGLNTAIEKLPDLIISDVMMPEMDGYALCAKLKSDLKTNHIPVVLLTAKAEDAHKIEGLQTGADDYLIKPFNPKELLVRMDNLIAQRQKLHDHFQRLMRLEPSELRVPSADDRFIEAAKKIVESHMDDEDFSVEQFAQEMAMSRMQLHRKLQSITGLSASKFVRAFRLNRAAQLLKQQSATITEIAYEVGFSSGAYFSTCFKEQFGKTPKEFVEGEK